MTHSPLTFDHSPMLLYSTQISPRLTYISALIGQELFKHDIQVTTNQDAFKNYNGPKINYGSEVVSESEFRIARVDLLFEKNIKSLPIVCFYTQGYKAFFQTSSGDFSFDIFAASFYLLSRYEEYLEHKKDRYGRYSHISSLAHKEDFLHLPLINIWLQDLKKALAKKYEGIQFNTNPFFYLPTYDIDIAFSYLNKGWWRNFGGFASSFIKGQWNDLTERAKVLLRKTSDPFDSYAWLDNLHSHCQVTALYFFLVAEKQKQYDKNISPSAPALQQLIRHYANHYKIGIHPSWQSGDNEDLLEKEIKLLENIAEKKIKDSRQHYLRFTLPQTYRKLIDAGIEKDYSMGYGTINGFRASIASSFYWYDLEKEETTSLGIYPFCFMDANAYFQQKLTPQQAFEELESYFHSIKAVNGLMITLWHNHFLGTDRTFNGWREIYEKFLTVILISV